MFSHYDQNNNGRLEAEELWQAAERDHLGQLSASCILADMLLFDDPDGDGTLDINEFYTAFSKLYSKWTFPQLRRAPFLSLFFSSSLSFLSLGSYKDMDSEDYIIVKPNLCTVSHLHLLIWWEF